MALGNVPRLDEVTCHSCLDAIDWDATSEAIGRVVTASSYASRPNLQESLMFVSSDGSPLTEFTLKRPPSKLVDKARELRDSPVAQAYFVALRCIERVRYMEADTEEFNLKRVNATGQERIQVGQRGERWNKVLSDEMQDVLGPNVLAEMGLMVLDMFERREDENF